MPGHLGGFGDTSRGVEGFSSSLCERAFCSGFLCRIRPVSWEGGVYSQGERDPLCASWSLSSSTSRKRVSSSHVETNSWYYRQVYREACTGRRATYLGVREEGIYPGIHHLGYTRRYTYGHIHHPGYTRRYTYGTYPGIPGGVPGGVHREAYLPTNRVREA